jgi:VanZ family protein
MKVLTVLFAIFIIIVIVLADMGRLGFLGALYDFPYGDKVGHFTLFGILGFLVILTILRSRRFADPKRVAIYWTLLLALLITVEEVSQMYIASRTFDLLDLSFSYAGTVMGACLAGGVAQKSR